MSSNIIKQCRLCGGDNIEEILDLGVQCYTGRFPLQGESDPPSAELVICRCNNCNLVQLQHFHASDEMYGMTYGYRSSVTKTMRDHLMEVKDVAIKWVDGERDDLKVLDIGSNDGTLLGYFNDMTDKLVGIDPCVNKHLDNYPESAQPISAFFSACAIAENAIYKKFNIVTSIAMFYDLDNPIEFACDVSSILDDNGIWITEQTHSHTLIESNCYDSICHEHATYLSLEAMEEICRRAKLKILDVHTNNINGGSFRLVISKSESSLTANEAAIEEFRIAENMLALKDKRVWDLFRSDVKKHKNELFDYISNAYKEGKTVLGYGASTKGNVLLQYCGIDKKYMKAILERDPRKYGMETPGTRIPIISEEEGRAMNPDVLVVFPWHFREEIISREKEFLNSGGVLLFPLPTIDIVTKEAV